MTDLTDLATVKAWLKIDVANSTDNGLLSQLITQYSQMIQSWMNRDIASQNYSDVISGAGTPTLMFPNYPVTAVSSVTIDGVSIPASSGYTSPGYRFTDTKLILNGYRFNRGDANIQVSYTAGFATIPSDLSRACAELVAFHYKSIDRIGNSSKSLAGETTSFLVKDFPPGVLTVLKQYRKLVPI